MVQMGKMQREPALLLETPVQMYTRIYREMKPTTSVPSIQIQYRRYATATSRISLHEGALQVKISDLLQNAPAGVQEALASILLSKLFRRAIDKATVARYRRYLNQAEVRRMLTRAKRERGRKLMRSPQGAVYDLAKLFDELNFKYFGGLMAAPELGWSLRNSRSTLGHYDPLHHVIVLSSVLDSAHAPALAVSYVMFHEMLHLKHPTEHRGARRCVHTKEFKRSERDFDQFREAKRALRDFLESTPLGT